MPNLEPLTIGEVLGIIGDKEVELAQQRRYIAQLEQRAAELEARLAELEATPPDTDVDSAA